MPLKLFRATVANADTESQKSLHTFLRKCLSHMHASEIWTKSYGLNYTKLWGFWQKTGYFKPLRVDAILEDISVHVAETINA